MYSVQGGVRRHRTVARFTMLITFLAVAGGTVAFLHSGMSLAYGSGSTKAASHHTEEASAPAPKLAEPTYTPAYSEGTDIAAKVSQAVTAAIPQKEGTKWSVSVYDISGKQWLAQINADQQMTSASLYKLYAVYGLSKVIPPTEWGSKTVADQSLSSCVDRMLRVSDNTCGDAVAELIGWGSIDHFDHAYGFNKTVLNLTSGPITTANDTTTFMSDLYQSKLFDVATTSFILDSLHHQLYRSGIPAGCAGCTVYNKTGNDANVSHDSAIITSGDSAYAVTIMSQNGSSAGVASIERALQDVMQNR